MNKQLNIIALNIPWPANYGGVIDIYYKLKALHACGVQIILHCFEYERPHAPELEDICREVYYYKRRTGLLTNLSRLPYNVYSRKNPKLIANLLKNDYPILFEGLHSCYYLTDPRLKGRIKIFRECNIEHDYYRHLAQAEHHPLRKCFFIIEALRFHLYQQQVAAADIMIAVSTTDAAYLTKIFPTHTIAFMPCFHANEQITAQPGQSDFILYHAKLSVLENERAALFLIENVFSRLDHTCILAGMNPSRRLTDAARPYPNIRIEANPSTERMDWLIREAQIHMLVTFQDTGLKLKLLNSLFAGRHTLVNQAMLAGSGLDSLCHIANTPAEMIASCNRLMQQPLLPADITRRKSLLHPAFSNKEQGERLYKMIYGKE
ncbi:MAG: glycosyltransferase family 1 protein [Tannerellaceae bacterium]